MEIRVQELRGRSVPCTKHCACAGGVYMPWQFGALWWYQIHRVVCCECKPSQYTVPSDVTARGRLQMLLLLYMLSRFRAALARASASACQRVSVSA